MPPADAAHRTDQAWQVLHAAGARRTIARHLVIQALAASDNHLSITDIHHTIATRRPEINISTVHRTIAYLVEHNIAHVLAWPGEARYGLNERPHIHAVCTGCGQIYEIAATELTGAIQQARKASPIHLDDTSLTLTGRCATCPPGEPAHHSPKP
jgi:Fur family transcriptional regulator, ferric uptake regulator